MRADTPHWGRACPAPVEVGTIRRIVEKASGMDGTLQRRVASVPQLFHFRFGQFRGGQLVSIQIH